MDQTTTSGKARWNFLRSQDNDMWAVITDGDFVPTTKERAVKDKSAWTTDEKAQVLLNSKARLFLSCALTMEESERVCHTLILDLKILTQIPLLFSNPFKFTMFSTVF